VMRFCSEFACRSSLYNKLIASGTYGKVKEELSYLGLEGIENGDIVGLPI
jgi:hypothetical protein